MEEDAKKELAKLPPKAADEQELEFAKVTKDLASERLRLGKQKEDRLRKLEEAIEEATGRIERHRSTEARLLQEEVKRHTARMEKLKKGFTEGSKEEEREIEEARAKVEAVQGEYREAMARLDEGMVKGLLPQKEAEESGKKKVQFRKE